MVVDLSAGTHIHSLLGTTSFARQTAAALLYLQQAVADEQLQVQKAHRQSLTLALLTAAEIVDTA